MSELLVESVARALVSLAGTVDRKQTGGLDGGTLAKAWREADYRNRLRTAAVVAELGRGVGGSALIRRLMDAFPIVSDDTTDVRTRAEFALLAALLRAGLPRPRTNAAMRLPGATYYPDIWFVLERLIVEVDGGIHTRAARAAADRARDLHMRQHGFVVVRFTNEEVEADPDRCTQMVVDAWNQQRAIRRQAAPC